MRRKREEEERSRKRVGFRFAGIRRTRETRRDSSSACLLLVLPFSLPFFLVLGKRLRRAGEKVFFAPTRILYRYMSRDVSHSRKSIFPPLGRHCLGRWCKVSSSCPTRAPSRSAPHAAHSTGMPDPPEWHKSAAAGSGEKWRHLLQRFLLSDTLSVIPPRGSWGQNPFPLSPFCTAEGLGSASTQYGRPGHQNAALTSSYIHCQGERPPWVIGGSCDQISLTDGREGVRGKKTQEQICDSALFFEGLKTERGV